MKISGNLDAILAGYRKAISSGKWAGSMHDDGEHRYPQGWRVRSWSWGGYDGGPSIRLSVLRHDDATYVGVDVAQY